MRRLRLVPEPGKDEMVERRNPAIMVKASCESYPGTRFFVKFAKWPHFASPKISCIIRVQRGTLAAHLLSINSSYHLGVFKVS